MSLVYGYDLKENDDIIVAPVQLSRMLSRLVLPGAALVNHLPFRMKSSPCDYCHEEELTAVFSATYPFMGPLAQL
jgi:hypothetical protein